MCVTCQLDLNKKSFFKCKIKVWWKKCDTRTDKKKIWSNAYLLNLPVYAKQSCLLLLPVILLAEVLYLGIFCLYVCWGLSLILAPCIVNYRTICSCLKVSSGWRIQWPEKLSHLMLSVCAIKLAFHLFGQCLNLTSIQQDWFNDCCNEGMNS